MYIIQIGRKSLSLSLSVSLSLSLSIACYRVILSSLSHSSLLQCLSASVSDLPQGPCKHLFPGKFQRGQVMPLFIPGFLFHLIYFQPDKSQFWQSSWSSCLSSWCWATMLCRSCRPLWTDVMWACSLLLRGLKSSSSLWSTWLAFLCTLVIIGCRILVLTTILAYELFTFSYYVD